MYNAFQVLIVTPILIFSSHVAGMVGLSNKTKGLKFCNKSGFLELYNDPEVKNFTNHLIRGLIAISSLRTKNCRIAGT